MGCRGGPLDEFSFLNSQTWVYVTVALSSFIHRIEPRPLHLHTKSPTNRQNRPGKQADTCFPVTESGPKHSQQTTSTRRQTTAWTSYTQAAMTRRGQPRGVTLRSSCLGIMVILLPSTLRTLPCRLMSSPSHTSTLSPGWKLCSRSFPEGTVQG